ncbi:MAG: TIGR03936 family radical SAM-associated protein [Clostridiales bacterium]|jgi:radical SAM-linked protein|nr:TIGR03936 family radical SAM-associated protein [Clostridiales bacterium]
MADIYKYRITYKKTGTARYLGHLDMMRAFQRAIRAAGLQPRYSEGFNPHIILSFAQPLPVGMTGLGELADTELLEPFSQEYIISELNAAFPRGLEAIAVRALYPGEKTTAALVRAAEYAITASVQGDGDLKQAAEELMESFSVIIRTEKKGKAPSEVNIRGHITELSVKGTSVRAVLSCGGQGNLRPEIMLSALCDKAGVFMDPNRTEYTRARLIMQNASEGIL